MLDPISLPSKFGGHSRVGSLLRMGSSPNNSLGVIVSALNSTRSEMLKVELIP